MFTFFKNLIRSARRYDHLSDAQVERIGLDHHIPGGLRSGIFDRQYVIGELLKRDELDNSKTAVIISITSLLLSILVFSFSFWLNLLQIKEVSQNQNSRSVDYVLSFDDRLNQGTNIQIINSIEDNKPLLVENGGKFSTHDIDNLLGIYNELSDIRDHHLVSDDLIEENFSDGLLKAYNNSEIKRYLEEIRKEDNTYFKGFDELAQVFK